MRNVKVLVSVLADDGENSEATYARAERVARFGVVQHSCLAYDPFADEVVTVLFNIVLWKDNSVFPLYRVSPDTLWRAFLNINLQRA